MIKRQILEDGQGLDKQWDCPNIYNMLYYNILIFFVCARELVCLCVDARSYGGGGGGWGGGESTLFSAVKFHIKKFEDAKPTA